MSISGNGESRTVGAWWPWIKWTLFLLVMAGVGLRGWKLWGDVRADDIRFSPGWFAAAVLLYVAGMFPSAAFWAALLKRFGTPISFGRAIRAHYCGQPGKYLPGKALVLVIRSTMAATDGVRVSTAAITATYETLVTMAAGLVLSVMLAPWVFTNEFFARRQILVALPDSILGRWMFAAAVFGASVVGLSIASRLFGLTVGKLVPKQFRAVEGLNWSSLGFGWPVGWYVAVLASWWLHGLGVGCTICSVTSQPFDVACWPEWTVAAAGSTSVAFLVIFAPAGLGVREGLFAEILLGRLGGAALAAAVVYRGVSFTGEILAAALLYCARFTRSAPSPLLKDLED